MLKETSPVFLFKSIERGHIMISTADYQYRKISKINILKITKNN